MPQSLRFDDLRLGKAAFEVRFDRAFLLWDRSGAIWHDLTAQIPKLEVVQSEPNKIVLARRGKTGLHLSVESERLGVIATQPDNKLEELCRTAGLITQRSVRAMEIPMFNRIGLRVSFVKEYPSQEDAAAALWDAGLIRVSSERMFNVAAPNVDPQIRLRRQDGTNGFSVQLKAETLKFEFEPNFDLGPFVEPIHEITHRVHLDLDCYIQAPCPPSSLIVSEWIAMTLHIIKRDSKKLFEV